MVIVGIMTSATLLFATSQVLASWRIYRLRQDLVAYREAINENRRLIARSYASEHLVDRRIRDIWDNPEISPDPNREIKGCKVIKKSLLTRRGALRDKNKCHYGEARETIAQIRRWQKLQFMS